MLLSQADSALAGQHIQGLGNSAAGRSSIGDGISGTVGNSSLGTADVLGVSSSLCLRSGNDVIRSEDLVLVQNGDSSLGGQRCNSAALHGNAPVSRSSEHRVSGADSLAGQNSDLTVVASA